MPIFYISDTSHIMSIQETVFFTFLPPVNEVWGKVMFSQVFAYPRGGGVLPLNPGGCLPLGLGVCVYLWVWGCALESEGVPLGLRGCTHPLDPPPPLRSSSGQYASYWNALLF